MTEEQEREIRRQQMASQGRLLADFSHEMRNHLAVIQEANGLLEDLPAMEASEGNALSASLKEVTVQVGKRVRASAELCRHLSGMAHRSDTPLSFFHVHDLLADLITLLARSARSRQIAVQFDPGQGIEPVYNEPALLQHVVYQLYAFFSEQLRSGQTLLISTAQGKEGVEITFCLDDAPQPDVSELSETVRAAITSLAASLKVLERPGEEPAASAGFRLRLLVPSLSSVG